MWLVGLVQAPCSVSTKALKHEYKGLEARYNAVCCKPISLFKGHYNSLCLPHNTLIGTTESDLGRLGYVRKSNLH